MNENGSFWIFVKTKNECFVGSFRNAFVFNLELIWTPKKLKPKNFLQFQPFSKSSSPYSLKALSL